MHENSLGQLDNRNMGMSPDIKYDDLYNEKQEPTNRLLSSKLSRKKIELDAQALRNRILLLENEESKVVRKIEETKRKALNIMQIKQKSREHDDIQNDHREYKRGEYFERQVFAREMKTELQRGVEESRGEYFEETKSKANEIKDTLQKLRDRYRIQKKEEQLQNIQNANSIRLFEKEVEDLQRNIYKTVKDQAKVRYESEIQQEEHQKSKVLGDIDRLELKEQELIKRLKITQNTHQLALTDLERINKNQEPVSI